MQEGGVNLFIYLFIYVSKSYTKLVWIYLFIYVSKSYTKVVWIYPIFTLISYEREFPV
jgi:hypothetical protein